MNTTTKGQRGMTRFRHRCLLEKGCVSRIEVKHTNVHVISLKVTKNRNGKQMFVLGCKHIYKSFARIQVLIQLRCLHKRHVKKMGDFLFTFDLKSS